MNVARPGRPLRPVDKDLAAPVESWVNAFRRSVVAPLLEGDDPWTLEQVSGWLKQRAPVETGEQKPGRAGADRLQSTKSGRGETSVQRMVSGRLVPTRDVVLDLLQLLEDRGLELSRDAAQELWRLYRPALRIRLPDVAELYDTVDERDAARTEVTALAQQVRVLEAEQGRALLSLTHASLKLLAVHRAAALSHKELGTATRSAELARAGEHQAQAHLEAALDRLDRLKDAYEHLRDRAMAVQQEATEDQSQWQERQASLLERLAQGEEALAQAVQDAQDIQAELEDERRTSETARRTALKAQQQAGLNQAEAATARQQAAASEARRLAEAAAAQHTIHDAESRHAQAMNAITHLEAELRQARAELRDAQQRLVRADGELVRTMRERAVEADAQDVLSQALTAMEDDQSPDGRVLIPAGSESTDDPRSESVSAESKSTAGASAPDTGGGVEAPSGPGGAGPGKQGGGGPWAGREPVAEVPRSRRGERPSAEPSLARGHSVRGPRDYDQRPLPSRGTAYRAPGYGVRVALLMAAAVTVTAGVATLVWWSWGRDTPLVEGHESPTPSPSPKAKKTPSLPPQPASDTVADIGDQLVNTASIMKLPVCADSALSLELVSKHNTYVGQDPRLTLTVKADGLFGDTVPCRVNVSRKQAFLTVTAAGEDAVLWKSSACTQGHSSVRWLEASRTRTPRIDFRWNRRSLGKDCGKGAAVLNGTYLAEASLSKTAGVTMSFVLKAKESAPPAAQPVATPSASRSATRDTDTSAGSANGSVGGLLAGGTGQTSSPATESPSDVPTGANGANGGDNGGGFFGGPTG
ncbi:hypothetical protein ABT040_35735 [Streptomyces sp. NPDC002688]|uniref:hypothetical protein n=1 Tax=Streptomyces sp. NPDC002688 TaxID=3154423 RepID=UPI00331EAE08